MASSPLVCRLGSQKVVRWERVWVSQSMDETSGDATTRVTPCQPSTEGWVKTVGLACMGRCPPVGVDATLLDLVLYIDGPPSFRLKPVCRHVSPDILSRTHMATTCRHAQSRQEERLTWEQLHSVSGVLVCNPLLESPAEAEPIRACSLYDITSLHQRDT